MPCSFSNFLVDLDDTLSAEWDFVAGGYRAAAAVLAAETHRDDATVFNTLVYEHMKYGRRGIMDRVAGAMSARPEIAREMVEAYRNHVPSMSFYPGAREALTTLRALGAKLAVVTDGTSAIQRRKVASLGLEEFVDTVVYCADLEAPKPDPAGFRLAMQRLGGCANDTVVVGDDPLHDLVAAARLGLACCRVRTGRYGLVEFTGEPVLADFPGFPDVAAWWVGGAC